MTVSRVLQNRKNEVTDETYERVVSALRELNYVPVRTAVQNHHTRTNVVGVVPHSSDVLGFALDLQTIGGISSRSAKLGYDVLLLQCGESEWMANRGELRFLDRRTDGYIFISPGSTEWRDVLERLVEHDLPVVVCYRRDVPEGVAWVDPDNDAMIRLAVDALVRAGHRRICYLQLPEMASNNEFMLADMSGWKTNFDNAQRRTFFQQRIAEHRIGVDEAPLMRVSGGYRQPVTDDDLDRLLELGVTGVVCFGALGLPLLTALRDRGLDVPRDMSIVNYDWSNESAIRGLSVVRFGYDTLGRLAMDAWTQLLGGCPARDCCKVVPVEYVEGKSVGPPRI